MKRFYILIIISIIGFFIGIAVIFYGDRLKSSDTVAIPSIKLPFKSFIAGTGIVEAESKNIAVGSCVAGVIKKVYIQSGDKIEKGQLLFEIDDTLLHSKMQILQAEIKAAKAKLISAKDYWELIKNSKKISSSAVTKKQYLEAKDRFYEAKEMLNLSKTKLYALKDQLRLYKIHSPIKGVVLSSEVKEGSFFDTHSNALIIGSSRFNVRVSINEYDIPKFSPHTKAIAYMRGNIKQKIDLNYAYTIPYVVPKVNLTGRSTERTDTRVLQVIYTVKKTEKFPLYAGELLDVFIETSKEEK